VFFRQRHRRNDSGQAALEYIGALIAVAAVTTAVIVAVPDVTPAAKNAVCRILQQSGCHSPTSAAAPVNAVLPATGSKLVVGPDTSDGTLIPFVSHRNVAPQLVCGRNGCVDITKPGGRFGFGHGPVVIPPKNPIQPRAGRKDKCAQGKGRVDNGEGSSSNNSAHTAPVWNVDWNVDPYGDSVRADWQTMIQQVRARAAAAGPQPLTNADSTQVGTVTIHTNDGRQITLYLQANDLYIIGWRTTRMDGSNLGQGTPGPTFQVNEPGTNHDLAAFLCPGAVTVPFTSNYNDLVQTAGGEGARVAINRQALSNAVAGLGAYDANNSGRRAPGAAGGLLTMATAIAEAARFPQVERSVAGMIENYPNTFGNPTLGPVDRDLITNWGDLSDLAEGRRTQPVSYIGGIARTALQAAALLALWRAPTGGGKIGPREDPPVEPAPAPAPAPKEPDPKEPTLDPHDPASCGAPFCG
jgi:hypothetical protein